MAPQPLPRRRIRPREVDHHVETTSERLVEIGPEVGGQDGESGEPFDALQQVRNLDVGVTIARIFDLAPLAEDGVGLVEQQHRVRLLRLTEDDL